MLNCAICGTQSPDGTATCPACGEASWLGAPAVSAPPVAPAPVVEPTLEPAAEPEAPAVSAPNSRRSQKPASS